MLKALNMKGWEKNAPWCVPSAIAMITGVPVKKAHERAAVLYGISKTDVEGIHLDDMVLLLNDLGYKAKQVKLGGKFKEPPTIKEFMAKGRDPIHMAMPMIFTTVQSKSFHAIAAQYNFVGDNATLKPVHINDFDRANQKVYEAFVVEEKIGLSKAAVA